MLLIKLSSKTALYIEKTTNSGFYGSFKNIEVFKYIEWVYYDCTSK